ncbi:transposase [Bacillus thuringiensis]|uniref:transposase n=1 Tax=Bacillus thuringiensis TaxID=1428 RepID=UPI001A8E21A6|nr:transposase [Bacillus thuringiensis]MDY7522148.1 transposase [Bacillus thuringiensis]
MDDDIPGYTKDVFDRVSENYNITLVEWNQHVDHVHIQFRPHPNTELKNSLMPTSTSSRPLERNFPPVKRIFGKSGQKLFENQIKK